jgi:hypothetical protein
MPWHKPTVGECHRLWRGRIAPGHAILWPQDHSLSVMAGPKNAIAMHASTAELRIHFVE